MVADVLIEPVPVAGRAARLLAVRPGAETMPAAAAFAGVLALCAAAPFERVQPLIRLPGQSISNLESAVIAVFAVWMAAVVFARRFPTLRTPLTTPWLSFIAAMGLAALAAPTNRTNAWHMAGRFAAAFAIFLLTVNAITSRRRLAAASMALVAAGTGAAVFVVLEYLGYPSVLQWLTAFRPSVITVGPLVRAGGVLPYPTVASMYLEVVFAVGVGLMLGSLDASRSRAVAMLFVTLSLVAYAIALTLTRAGLVSMAAVLAWVGAVRGRALGWERGVCLLGALAIAVLAVSFGSRSTAALWLRLTTEGQENWYRAAIAAPREVTVPSATIRTVPIEVTNTGRLAWDSQAESPFFLSYHWLDAATNRYVGFEGLRTAFETQVAPGATVSLRARVRGPDQPGRYRLAWDIVQENRLWFSLEPGAVQTISVVTVEGAASGRPDEQAPPSDVAVRPGRFVLWAAAARMLRDHPLLGVGPDNFRLRYASYAGLAMSDERRHSNNMYVEMFVGGGLIGGAAFLWLMWAAGRMCARAAARTDGRALGAGLAAAALAIALHGFVDSFLGFAPTYILFALTVGLAAASARCMEVRADAPGL